MSLGLKEKAALCYNSALAKKAVNVMALDVRGLTDMADVFIIASGTSRRHVQTIVDYIEDSLREFGEKNYHIEGYENARWTLIDAGDVIVHVFQEEARDYYRLEGLWADAPPFEVEAELEETSGGAHG